MKLVLNYRMTSHIIDCSTDFKEKAAFEPCALSINFLFEDIYN